MHCAKSIIVSLMLSVFVTCVSFVSAQEASVRPINIVLAYECPQAEFAAAEIRKALNQGKRFERRLPSVNDTGVRQIVLTLLSDQAVLTQMKAAKLQPDIDLAAEGYVIAIVGKTIYILGKDTGGLMYGGLELAEIIETQGIDAVKPQKQNPKMAMRGTKFNIPLDARTPSYTDVCDAAQHNIAEMWSFDFWREYIDALARYRYNFISCWSLHPFPSLVRVPDYPDVALADVHRSTVRWKEIYDLEGTGFDAPEIVTNVEILKKMTIEDKIEFWRKVMAYGKSRNVDFYFVTWNIFINGTEGKYGITDAVDNPITRNYFRKSVKQMFLTYPDLKGIGLTTGENMYGASFQEKEDWAYDTYALGILDAAKEQPGRKMTFIHRQHMAGALDIAEKFKPIIDHPDIEFIFSFKYAAAHVYSSTTQTYHPGFVKDIQSKGHLKTIWTLRNDDIYYFRWGAPDFVREFIQNIPYDVSRGYYYGSDQYIWGREFLSREPESPRQIEIEKHWYQWMLWGRLGYDPMVSNERFQHIIQARYPGVDAVKLFSAWQEASLIYPKTTGFHWGSLDFEWYIESSQSRPRPAQTASGFHDVNRFITLEPHKGTAFISIPDYVQKTLAGEKIKGTTPLEAAKQIHEHADKALQILEGISHQGDKELRLVLDDIRTIAFLGKYYAHKIEAATELAFFRKTLNIEKQQAAIKHLQQTVLYWRYYASLGLSNYHNPLWTNRVGYVDWRDTYRYVIHDIRTLGGDLTIPSMQPSTGGIVLEAETARFDPYESSNKITGFTGTGYITIDRGVGKYPVSWTFDAPKTGRYVLEFRYINSWERETDLKVSVNGKYMGFVSLWNSGTTQTWVWDRMAVDMQRGENVISVQAGGRIHLDSMNLLGAE